MISSSEEESKRTKIGLRPGGSCLRIILTNSGGLILVVPLVLPFAQPWDDGSWQMENGDRRTSVKNRRSVCGASAHVCYLITLSLSPCNLKYLPFRVWAENSISEVHNWSLSPIPNKRVSTPWDPRSWSNILWVGFWDSFHGEQVGECGWWWVGREPTLYKSHEQRAAPHIYEPV